MTHYNWLMVFLKSLELIKYEEFLRSNISQKKKSCHPQHGVLFKHSRDHPELNVLNKELIEGTSLDKQLL